MRSLDQKLYHFKPSAVSPDTVVQSPRLVQQAVPAGAADTPEVRAAATARIGRLHNKVRSWTHQSGLSNAYLKVVYILSDVVLGQDRSDEIAFAWNLKVEEDVDALLLILLTRSSFYIL